MQILIMISLENNLEMKVAGFLDDNPQFHRQIVLGQIVYDPLNIDKLIIKKDIESFASSNCIFKHSSRSLEAMPFGSIL